MFALLIPLVLGFSLDEIKIVVDTARDIATITDEQVEQLQRTAPSYLTLDAAHVNLVAATIAANRYRVERSIILSIAHHESRYQAQATTAEPGGKTSCGVMTPEPLATCRPSTLLDGYLAGAKHLRDWLDTTNSETQALLGYAGGWRMIRACAKGEFRRSAPPHDDLCQTPAVFRARARWIAHRDLKPQN